MTKSSQKYLKISLSTLTGVTLVPLSQMVSLQSSQRTIKPSLFSPSLHSLMSFLTFLEGLVIEFLFLYGPKKTHFVILSTSSNTFHETHVGEIEGQKQDLKTPLCLNTFQSREAGQVSNTILTLFIQIFSLAQSQCLCAWQFSWSSTGPFSLHSHTPSKRDKEIKYLTIDCQNPKQLFHRMILWHSYHYFRFLATLFATSDTLSRAFWHFSDLPASILQ